MQSTHPYDVARIHSLDKLLTMEPPPILWDIDQFLARNERMVMYGEFASLKSWLLMAMTLSFATGSPWLGQYATVPRSVLYLDEENNKYTAIRRFQRLYKGLGSPILHQPIQIASRLGIRVSQAFPVRFKATLAALSFKPDVIIVETLRRVLPGVEVDQGDISAFWNIITEVIGDDMTIVVAHHMRKANFNAPDENNRDRASGSTDILAGCDVAYAVQRLKAGHVRVECVKSREVMEPTPFDVSLHGEEDEPTILVASPRELNETETFIMTTIGGMADKTIHTSMLELGCKQQGISRATMFRYLKQLQDRTILTSPGHGLWSLIPPKQHK